MSRKPRKQAQNCRFYIDFFVILCYNPNRIGEEDLYNDNLLKKYSPQRANMCFELYLFPELEEIFKVTFYARIAAVLLQ